MRTIRCKKNDTERVFAVLKAGGLVAFPTDTVFGLACIMDKKAIDKVYEVKGRSFDKPLPVMCDSLKMIKKIAVVSEDAEKIYEKFMPGALTLIFEKKSNVADWVTMGKDSIGIRVPDDEFILNIIKELKKPLMVTSANLSNEGSLLKWEDVYECLKGKIDAIVCEDARGEKASTIIDVRGEIKVLRKGPISLKEIREAIK
ncbi:MAG: threonylcarbamoyl-AMP synthase [Erysipelotrichaceae bacterium]|nr:threonylcarbamoyl-AMP synthase [Erysipelotrichaceae bacterium]